VYSLLNTYIHIYLLFSLSSYSYSYSSFLLGICVKTDVDLLDGMCKSSNGARIFGLGERQDYFQLYLSKLEGDKDNDKSNPSSTTLNQDMGSSAQAAASSSHTERLVQLAQRPIVSKVSRVSELTQQSRESSRRQVVQQQQEQQQALIEAEHESLGAELAGELDAVLQTEMKMREVAEIMALFR
jgi:hypothetical protein